jgi:serine/threonine-protein kinase
MAGEVQTKGGMIIGTAAYLAPEQVSGGTSDARTDVYAAGVMLFELLTGKQPHTGESPLAVAHKHVNEFVPPPSSIQPGLSPALDTLVAMATSRDPDLRPANAGQLLRAIQEVRSGHTLPGTAPHSGKGWMPGSGLVVAGASALPSLGPQSSSSDHLLPAPAGELHPAGCQPSTQATATAQMASTTPTAPATPTARLAT